MKAPHHRDDHTWVETWIGPPRGDDVKKLFDALGSVEDASPYLTRVKRFVVDGPLRTELGVSLYDETTWGVIRWSKSIGRPSTPALASGFGIIHQFDLSYDAGDHRIGGWTKAGDPIIWDGPDDADMHAVSFMLRGMAGWTNRVIVGFASPDVQWQPIDKPWMPKRQRFVTYPAALAKAQGEFEVSKGGAPVDLGVFEVVRTW